MTEIQISRLAADAKLEHRADDKWQWNWVSENFNHLGERVHRWYTLLSVEKWVIAPRPVAMQPERCVGGAGHRYATGRLGKGLGWLVETVTQHPGGPHPWQDHKCNSEGELCTMSSWPSPSPGGTRAVHCTAERTWWVSSVLLPPWGCGEPKSTVLRWPWVTTQLLCTGRCLLQPWLCFLGKVTYLSFSICEVNIKIFELLSS
jgi:hypothetical protein